MVKLRASMAAGAGVHARAETDESMRRALFVTLGCVLEVTPPTGSMRLWEQAASIVLDLLHDVFFVRCGCVANGASSRFGW